MDENTRIIIEVRLEKAREDLMTARELLSLGRLRGAVNRAYYAVYHVTTALLLTEDIERRRHSGVQSAFSHYFIKTGKVEPEYARILTAARKARESSDYSDRIELDRETAEEIVADAERFISRIERYLANTGIIPTNEALEEQFK